MLRKRKRQVIPFATKVEAIREHRNGLTLSKTAKKYNVHISTVHNWNKDPKILGGLSKFASKKTFSPLFTNTNTTVTTTSANIHTVKSVNIEVDGQEVRLTRDDINRISNLQKWI